MTPIGETSRFKDHLLLQERAENYSQKQHLSPRKSF